MPEDASTMALGTLGIAAILVGIDPLWRPTRHFVTLVHEGGHAAMALVTGNWVHNLFLWRQGGGLTTTSGGHTPSLVARAAAGYTAPPLAGLLLARGVDQGWSAAGMLAVGLVVLGILLLFHGNWFGLWVIAGTAAAFAIVLIVAEPYAQLGAVVATAWILLLGGLRRTLEVLDTPLDEPSDARNLSTLTAIPQGVWFASFLLVAVLALVAGARWLLQA